MESDPLGENRLCARTHASFRLSGGSLDPGGVTAALGLSPAWAAARGDRLEQGPDEEPIRQRTGVWSISSRGSLDSTSLERHLIQLLDEIEPRSAELAELRIRDGLEADFFCFWESAGGHGGPQISAATLGRVAALDAALGIDFYGP
jgi:hypothetical protein